MGGRDRDARSGRAGAPCPGVRICCRRHRRPKGHSSVDALSDALQHIRLQGAWFLNGEFREPWCVDIPPPEQLAA
ncbi:MAG: cupin domain-containing protein, partial [Ottowia sp.]|nr:cupin domain-containing protein [Ottowia sp.]